MELINYIVSILLVAIGILIKFKPSLIPSYQSLSQKKQNGYPVNHIMWGLFVTAFLIPIVAYNIRFLEYPDAANWSFIVTLGIGIFFTFRVVNKKLNQD